MSLNSDGRRVLKAERMLREELSRFLISGLQDELPGLITIPQVRMSKDLRNAKVYVGLLQSDSDETEEADLLESIELLNERAYEIQGHIGRALKMKFCPKIKFYRDEMSETVLRIEKLIEENKKSSADAEGDTE